jgi:hypothetical protein
MQSVLVFLGKALTGLTRDRSCIALYVVALKDKEKGKVFLKHRKDNV